MLIIESGGHYARPRQPADKAARDHLAALADKMLSLKKREHDEPNPQVQTVIARQIGAVDRQIDEAVYKLYGLSDEEIKVIEKEKTDDCNIPNTAL